tara:strand:+ start:86 stop:592 length:507 start_codon:yes stop_codon:yes gene_type:complete
MEKVKNNGFTLVELLLYITVASTLLLAVVMFWGSLQEVGVSNSVVSEVNQEATRVMQEITQAVRNAEGITTPSAGGSGATLTLDVVDSGDDPTTYAVSGGILQVTEGSSTYDLTSSKVTISGLTFENLSRTDTPGVVQISFTLSYNNASGRTEYDYTADYRISASLRR